MSDWPELEGFLPTDPRDVGCEQALAVRHVYVELVLAGARPEREHPGVAAHLSACGPCNEGYEGLLNAARNREASRADHDEAAEGDDHSGAPREAAP